MSIGPNVITITMSMSWVKLNHVLIGEGKRLMHQSYSKMQIIQDGNSSNKLIRYHNAFICAIN